MNIDRGLAVICAIVLLCAGGCSAGSGGNAPATEAAVTMPPSEPETVPEPSAETETAPEPSHRGKLIGENQDLLNDEQKEAIFNYMDRYYEALSSLEMKDLSDLFASSASG